MSDKRKTGEGAMKGWDTRRQRDISLEDICYLSRIFNAGANLRKSSDERINEWLKRQIEMRTAEG